MVEKEEIIKYRLACAKETLAEVKVLSENGFWNMVANRLYYACFYTLSALLLHEGHNPLTHTGVKTLFNNIFVKNGTVSKELGRFYGEIFHKRQDGNYKDLIIFDEELIKPLILETIDFIEKIQLLIPEIYSK
jgi:uncharacterized protein